MIMIMIIKKNNNNNNNNNHNILKIINTVETLRRSTSLGMMEFLTMASRVLGSKERLNRRRRVFCLKEGSEESEEGRGSEGSKRK